MSGLLDDTVGPRQTWLRNRFYMLEILRLRLRFLKVTSVYHLVLFSFYKLGEALTGVMTYIRDRSPANKRFQLLFILVAWFFKVELFSYAVIKCYSLN